MANTKTIITRIKNKADLLSAWRSSPVNQVESSTRLLDGEIAIIRVPTGNSYINPVTGVDEPEVALLMKVGDGTTTFDQLPWMSGKASDVYDWAKKSTPDWADIPVIPGAKLALNVIESGNGNAFTDVSYDETTKTITLIKGAKFALEDHTHELPDYTDSYVKGQLVTEVDQTDGLISVNRKAVDVAYDSTERKIKLTIGGETVGNGIDASNFIKDGMIKSVELKAEGEGYAKANGPYLVFTWNIDDAIGTDNDTAADVLWVSVKDLVDVYTAGTGLTLTNGKFAHQAKPTTGTAQAATAGIGRTYVTEVLVDDLGHIAGVKTATEVDQVLPHDHDDRYKRLQTPVQDPTANGKAVTFIDTISQDAQGVITVTKKTVDLPTDFGVTKITSNDTTSGPDSNVSGLKITPAEGTGVVNIEIDDTVTFIFDCGGAPV